MRGGMANVILVIEPPRVRPAMVASDSRTRHDFARRSQHLIDSHATARQLYGR